MSNNEKITIVILSEDDNRGDVYYINSKYVSLENAFGFGIDLVEHILKVLGKEV